MNGNADAGKLKQTPEIKQGVTRWIVKSIVFLLVMPAVLFVPAGRLEWPMAWILVGMVFGFQSLTALILLPRQPDLIAERSGLQKGTKKWDAVIASLAAVWLPMLSWVVAGLDVRFGWSPQLSTGIRITALVAVIAGFAVVFWSMASNRFFSATVRIQKDRSHKVVTGGPYQYVRHPGYVGAVLFSTATPVMLGSIPALIPGTLAAGLMILRTFLEDRTLQEELEGYKDYTQQVRFRLLPGIW